MVRPRTVFLALAFFVQCAFASDHPRLTVRQVIRLADAEARRQGYSLREFKPPQAHYNYTEPDDTWWVFYDGKVAAVGNHFSVTIEDKTKKLWLMPGR